MLTKIHNKAAVLALGLCLALAALPASLFAQTQNLAFTADGGTDVGFFVRAVLPENQINPDLSYFDLLMQPGQSQRLEIEVVNEGSEAITVDIAAISASTSRNGVIDYRTPDVRDETLRHPFSELASLEQDELTVPGGSSARLAFSLQMPAEEYDGVVLGGIVMTRRDQAQQDNGGGTTINNIYHYVVGVQLRETEVPVLPDFELLEVEAGLVNYRPAILHYIRNFEAAAVKGMLLSADITRDGEVVATVRMENVDMAPNSVMPLAVTLDGELVEGEYTTDMTLELEGEIWHFTRTWVVGRGEVEAINGNDIPGARFSLPGWAWALIILAILLLLLVLWLLFILFKRRRDEEDDEEQDLPPADRR